MSTSLFRTARARYAALTRSCPEDDPELVAARRLMLEQGLLDAIDRALKNAPPLTDEVRAHIDALLADRPGAAS